MARYGLLSLCRRVWIIPKTKVFFSSVTVTNTLFLWSKGFEPLPEIL